MTFNLLKSIIPIVAATAVILTIAAPQPWIGLVYIVLGLVLISLGHLILKVFIRDFNDDSIEAGNGIDLARLISVRLGGGFLTLMLLWTAAFYLSKQFWLLSIVVFLLCALGIFYLCRDIRSRRIQLKMIGISFVIVLGLSSLLALAHYGVYEVRIGDEYVYRLFRDDFGFHSYIAALIRENGLPLVEITGSAAYKNNFLIATGLQTVAAGICKTTLITPFQAMRILAVWGYIAIALSCLALLKAKYEDGAISGLLALTVFIFGGLFLITEALRLNLGGIISPYTRAIVAPGAASGAFFHSITQVWATALTAVGFLTLKKSLENKNGHILLFGLLVAGSGLVKPSYVIFIFPAAIILFALTSAPLKNWLALAISLAIGLTIYFLPHLIDSSQIAVGREGWRIYIHPKKYYYASFFILYLGLIGVGWIFWTRQVKNGWRRFKAKQNLDWLDYWAVSFIGAVVFAMLFAEKNRQHLNEVWGMCGLLALGAPQIVGYVLKRYQSATRSYNIKSAKIGIYSMAILLMLHLLSGSLYALYNATYIRKESFLPVRHTKQLQELQENSQAQDKFAIDPEFAAGSSAFLTSYLARPWLQNYFAHPLYIQRDSSFRAFLKSPSHTNYNIIENINYLVLANNRPPVEMLISEKGWRSVKALEDGFSLWQNTSITKDKKDQNNK
ncbi:MAG: hypothetical protein FJY65_04880 [Calditrichaeota bacterium]|nr:hypothetical protein [Calditrichota bacterium]